MQPFVNHPGKYIEKVIRWQWRSGTSTMYTTKQPLILLISGWAGSGKDAAAALLVEELGFTKCAFATALKLDAAAETGIPVIEFHSHALKDQMLAEPCYAYPHAKTPREVLLTHAARARAADPDIYSKSVAVMIEALENHRFVISDWRIKRERDYFLERFPRANIVTMRITRTTVDPRAEDIEHELDEFPFDLCIQNDGSISDLRDALRHALRPHLV